MKYLFLFLALLLPLHASEKIEPSPYDAQIQATSAGDFFAQAQAQVGRAYNGATTQTCYVVPFKLPYLAPGQTITSASLNFPFQGSYFINGATSVQFNADVYGLTRYSTYPLPVANSLTSDYYMGANDSANTRFGRIATPSTAAGTLTYSGSNLLTWLNAQISASSGIPYTTPVYVFVRINPDASTTGLAGAQGYNFSTGDSPTRANIPTLTYTTSGTPTTTAGRLQFSFTLGSAQTTSAGVYDGSGTLIRRLWENVPYSSGTSYGAWDGNNDLGVAAPTGTYTVKVHPYTISTNYDGTVGNTSANQSGFNVWRSFAPIRDLDIAGTVAYPCVGYNEQQCLWNSFALASPQVCNHLYSPSAQPGVALGFVATDGTVEYQAKIAGGQNAIYTYICAIRLSDNSLYTFSSGTAVPASPAGYEPQKYTSCVDLDTTVGQPNGATGLAIQKTGNFLFVAHSNSNTVKVFNKTTGASVTTLSITTPGPIKCDGAGNLWVISGTSVSKYTINSSTGAATFAFTLTGLTQPLGIGANSSLVLVCDGGATQEVRAYNLTGTMQWSYGTAGGMATNGPTINTHTFYWSPTNSTNNTFAPSIALVPADGSFWVTDPNNCRQLHYSVSGTTITYVEQQAWRPVNYVTCVDQSDSTKVHSEFMEYGVDYTKPIGGTNGSWTMTHNWLAALPATDGTHLYQPNFQFGISNASTFSGHTYAFLYNFATSRKELWELLSNSMRYTNINFNSGPLGAPEMMADGTLRTVTTSGSVTTFHTQALTSIDGSGNPVWASATSLGSFTATATTPQTDFQGWGTRVELTAGNIIPVIDNSRNEKFHLGGLPIGASAYQFQSAYAVQQQTAQNYTGQPSAGQTLVIGTGTYTYVASSPTGNQALIAGTLAGTLGNMSSIINSTAPSVTSTTNGTNLLLTQTGTFTNLALSSSVTNASWDQNNFNGGLGLSYGGSYPTHGGFDASGNGLQYNANVAMVFGHAIVFGYHGEFWKSSEASKFDVYSEDGLCLSVFGSPQVSIPADNAVAGFTGNGWSPWATTGTDGNNYVYCNSEQCHGGPVRFSVSGISSISTLTGSGTLGQVITVAGIPAAPTGLGATPGNTQVVLSWTASASATSYNVLRSLTNGSGYSSIATNVSPTTYTDTGLTNGTTYYYVVQAVNSSGTSGNSNQASATPSIPTPGIPTSLMATGLLREVDLTWTASSNATTYNVKRALITGGPYSTIATGVSGTSYNNTGLADVTTYYYVVSAVNTSGESANSTLASATTTTPTPAAPTGLSATAASGQVSLTWSATTYATTYNVLRSTTSGSGYSTVASSLVSPSYVDTGLTNGTTYFYVVQAVNGTGTSPNSTEVNGTPHGISGTITIDNNPASAIRFQGNSSATITIKSQ